MEARELVRGQLAWVHQLLAGTIDGCSPEAAYHHGEGWTISPISAIYVHIALTQDGIVHGLVQNRPTLLEADGWGAKLGLDPAAPGDAVAWADKRFDLATAGEYVAAVQQATDDFLASAPDETLLKPLETPMGTMPALTMLANVGVAHVASHWGEIAALRGVQGEKGLPF